MVFKPAALTPTDFPSPWQGFSGRQAFPPAS
jgi:hypothetical protein